MTKSPVTFTITICNACNAICWLVIINPQFRSELAISFFPWLCTLSTIGRLLRRALCYIFRSMYNNCLESSRVESYFSEVDWTLLHTSNKPQVLLQTILYEIFFTYRRRNVKKVQKCRLMMDYSRHDTFFNKLTYIVQVQSLFSITYMWVSTFFYLCEQIDSVESSPLLFENRRPSSRRFLIHSLFRV